MVFVFFVFLLVTRTLVLSIFIPHLLTLHLSEFYFYFFVVFFFALPPFSWLLVIFAQALPIMLLHLWMISHPGPKFTAKGFFSGLGTFPEYNPEWDTQIPSRIFSNQLRSQIWIPHLLLTTPLKLQDAKCQKKKWMDATIVNASRITTAIARL